MFERLRAGARLRVQRAVAEVIHDSEIRAREEAQDRHDDLVARLDTVETELARTLRTLAAARGELAEAHAAVDDMRAEVLGVEYRERRDITAAADRLATEQTAAFVAEHMPTAERFANPRDALEFALREVSVVGLALEFGVASGATLDVVAQTLAPTLPVYGFDVFTGLPETWRTGFEEGVFAQDEIPEIPGAGIVAGLFEETLPDFLDEHPEPVAFLHLDADLYSSTRTVLELVGPRLQTGSIVLMDEFFNFPGWQRHEFLAWSEFAEKTGVAFEYLGYAADNEQVVVRIS
ncbi:TylF/MycF/NovP-related O-methyltransferase [Rhodococcus sp. HNM0569]|uniref:TylF/MycF/NovP-related O-methyltransferase n=1 Tax=Rhodococcus sp. HNM0569 TaxID=2716340 RepID=UPI00146C6FC5|nr:TylF/MycF/NovP-related O-methyltransferase [Rhodococcus sp. HNM0569]NLU83572.1 class I SAM-dependent methyltransferase [Rhodococcus sp. HNM0569]